MALSPEQQKSIFQATMSDLFSQVSAIFKDLQNTQVSKFSLIKTKRDLAIRLNSKLDEIKKEIYTFNAQVDEPKQYDLSKINTSFFNLFQNIDAIYADAEEHRDKNANIAPLPLAQNPPSVHVHKPTLKLPAIEIPTFAGNLVEFPKFFNLFEAVYLNHTGLSDPEKLFYLLSSVTGDAHALISEFPYTNQGLADAIQALKDRYRTNVQEI